MTTVRAVLGALGLCLATAGAASAQVATEQRTFPVERLHIPLNRHGIVDVEWAEVPEHMSWNAGMWLGHTNDPLVYSDRYSERELVSGRVGGSLHGALALRGKLELGVELPIIAYQWKSPPALGRAPVSAPLSSSGIGDLRLV